MKLSKEIKKKKTRNSKNTKKRVEDQAETKTIPPFSLTSLKL